MGEMTVQYLCRIFDFIGDNHPLARNIIRNMREKCMQTKDNYGHFYRLPASLFGRSSLCPLCLSPWTSGRYKLRIRSNGVNKKRKRCLSKLFIRPAAELNKFQTSLIERLTSQGNNFMELTCCECNKVTKIGFKKSGLVSDDRCSIEGSTLPNLEANKKIKKKKKKKDLLCGLKPSAVAQVLGIKGHIQTNISKRNIKDSLNKSVQHSNLSTCVKKSESVENIQTDSNYTNDSESDKLLNSSVNNNDKISTDSHTIKINQSLIDSTNRLKTSTTDPVKLNRQHINSYINRNESESSHVIRKRSINSLVSTVPSNEIESDIHVKKIKCDNIEKNNLGDSVGSSLRKINGSEIKSVKFSGGNVDIDKVSKSLKDSNKQSGDINNLLSQPSLNIIQNQNNKQFNKSKDQGNQKTDSFNRQKTITKNLKINNNSSNNTSNSNCSLPNNLQQFNSSNKGKKKKSKKHKLKGTKIIRDNYQVYEQSNCKNSLCVNDLLHLT